MTHAGNFSHEFIDFFAGPAYDHVRLLSEQRAAELRRQGFIGVAMAQQAEIAYTGLIEVLEKTRCKIHST